MKPGWWDYLRAAFNARPFGMWIPPNWLALGFAGLLGTVHPGFWVIAGGLELGYLLWLSTNPRFRRTVRARLGERAWTDKVERLRRTLGDRDRAAYEALEARCRSILEQHRGTDGGEALADAQAASLGNLLWMYLRLLAMRAPLERVRQETPTALTTERDELRARLARSDLADELRRSLSSQLDIVEQRLRHRDDAREQLAFLNAELDRIEHQVELVREQSAVTTDPSALSSRLDEVTAALSGTAAWVREQQRTFGLTEDLVGDAPRLPHAPALEER